MIGKKYMGKVDRNRDYTNIILEKYGSNGSGYNPVTGFCHHSKGHLVFIKRGNFLTI
jgi:hypothetical protein